jgi:hypothetical protein
MMRRGQEYHHLTDEEHAQTERAELERITGVFLSLLAAELLRSETDEELE